MKEFFEIVENKQYFLECFINSYVTGVCIIMKLVFLYIFFSFNFCLKHIITFDQHYRDRTVFPPPSDKFRQIHSAREASLFS